MARDNGMPPPSAIWIALGIVAAATAVALGPRRRRVYLSSMAALVDAHRSRETIIAFGKRNPRTNGISRAIAEACVWIGRLLLEIDT